MKLRIALGLCLLGPAMGLDENKNGLLNLDKLSFYDDRDSFHDFFQLKNPKKSGGLPLGNKLPNLPRSRNDNDNTPKYIRSREFVGNGNNQRQHKKTKNLSKKLVVSDEYAGTHVSTKKQTIAVDKVKISLHDKIVQAAVPNKDEELIPAITIEADIDHNEHTKETARTTKKSNLLSSHLTMIEDSDPTILEMRNSQHIHPKINNLSDKDNHNRDIEFEKCWVDGTYCGAGTTCNSCCNEYSFWAGKGFTMCGREPCWKDGIICGGGTTCNSCCNGSSYWFGKQDFFCAQEPCWVKDTLCGLGTTCHSCCKYPSGWWNLSCD